MRLGLMRALAIERQRTLLESTKECPAIDMLDGAHRSAGAALEIAHQLAALGP